jgi:hypothetical protein
MDDIYTEEILKMRYISYLKIYIEVINLKKKGLNIRHTNPPEDITENITKFIIRNYDNDQDIIWCKAVNKKYKLKGDLYSPKYNKNYPPEIKSFTSNGPSQFSPSNKFSVLYFLDLRNWTKNKIILWHINLSSDSNEFKNIKVNKTQTVEDQKKQGRGPRISWNLLYPQISNFCEKIYDDNFDNIFIKSD